MKEENDYAMNDRVKALRNELKLTLGKFGEKICLTDKAIWSIENKQAFLKEQNIKLICYEFGVNEEWLRSGIGDMFTEDKDASPEERELIEIYRKLLEANGDFLLESARNLLKTQLILQNDTPPLSSPAQKSYHQESAWQENPSKTRKIC